MGIVDENIKPLEPQGSRDYLFAPVPHRGERNRPWFVEHTAAKIAEIKGISYEKVCEVTCENAKRFFNMYKKYKK